MSEYGLRKDRERVEVELEIARQAVQAALDRLEIIDRLLKQKTHQS